MAALTTCRAGTIPCACGHQINYPIPGGLPPIGSEALCTECLRLWKLTGYEYVEDHGTHWTWVSYEHGTLSQETIAAAVVRAYEEIGPIGAIDYDEELRVLARFDQPEGGHC